MGKRARTYWIQVCYSGDRNDKWVESFADYQATCRIAAQKLADPDVELVLLLRPWVRKGAFASDAAIVADFQREPVKGAKVMHVGLPVVPKSRVSTASSLSLF